MKEQQSERGVSIVDDRKMKILAAVVDEYVRTGEPVIWKVQLKT